MFKTYKDVLRDFRGGISKIGGTPTAKVREQLRKHRAQRFRIAAALTAALILSAVTMAYSAWLRGQNPADTWTALIFGTGSAATGGVLLKTLLKIWDDYSRTDLVLILLEDAADSDVLPLVDRALRYPSAASAPPPQAAKAGALINRAQN